MPTTFTEFVQQQIVWDSPYGSHFMYYFMWTGLYAAGTFLVVIAICLLALLYCNIRIKQLTRKLGE